MSQPEPEPGPAAEEGTPPFSAETSTAVPNDMKAAFTPEDAMKRAGAADWVGALSEFKLVNARACYQGLMDCDHSGEHALFELTPEQASTLLKQVDADGDGFPDFLADMNPLTLMFWVACCRPPTAVPMDYIELPTWAAAEHENLYPLAGLGIKLPTTDEQWLGGGSPNAWQIMVGASLKSTWGDWDKDESLAPSLIVDSPEKRMEAILALQQAFAHPDGEGSSLPASKTPWDELSSDAAQGKMARCGMAQIYCKLNTETEDGRGELGDVVADVRVLGSIDVRPSFEKLGAAAYFRRGADSWEITAIDWCHEGRLVLPSDPAWEHAKWVWRVSVGVHMTAVEHLVHTHWIVSNAVVSSVRQTLCPTHPVRRVLHVNTFNTARINAGSAKMLHPQGALLHRLSPFTGDGLHKAFDHAASVYKFQTWPQKVAASDLPQSVKDELPIFVDGLQVWNVMHEFYSGYVGLYYADDAAVQADAELSEYWKFELSPQYSTGLPELTKAGLADQLTHAVFGVTAYHEIVGSVIGYSADPAGVGFSVRPGLNMSDKQHLIGINSLAAQTGTPMPKFMECWDRMLDLGEGSRHDEAKQLREQMVSQLQAVSADIKERNKTRNHPYLELDPEQFECSVNL